MGKFKRELTYTGDTSKLTNIQKRELALHHRSQIQHGLEMMC